MSYLPDVQQDEAKSVKAAQVRLTYNNITSSDVIGPSSVYSVEQLVNCFLFANLLRVTLRIIFMIKWTTTPPTLCCKTS